MKYIILLSFIYTLNLFAQPLWLYKLPHEENEIIGYGIANTQIQAQENAIADIVKSLHVVVDSSTNISKSSDGTNYSKNISSSLQTKAKATLSGVKVIKSEKIDDIYYCAVIYDNSPLRIKLKNALPHDINSSTQNSYLTNTPLYKSINKELGLKIGFEIVRKDNLWQIAFENISFVLNQDEFYELFSKQSTPNITLNSNKKIYKESDELYFEIKSKNKGYISLLYVEHNGKVGVLFENIASSDKIIYPNNKSEEVFRIANPYSKTIEELYVAIFSTSKLDLSEFENVSQNLLDESNFNFDKLLDIIDKKEFSTIKIKIRGK